MRIREFDDHHRKLFEAAAKLNEAIGTAAEKRGVEKTLRLLIEYCRVHFEAGEKVMARFYFPELESHKKEHRRLMEHVRKPQEQFEKDDIHIDENVMNFLKDWVIDHILTTDRKYSAFLNARGVT